MKLPLISKCLVTQLLAFAPKGVGLEDIEARLVALFKSEWGRFNKVGAETGKVKITKDCLGGSMSERQTYASPDEVAHPAIRFWYFVQETELYLGKVGDAHVGIPTSHKQWLQETIGVMKPAVGAEKEKAPVAA